MSSSFTSPVVLRPYAGRQLQWTGPVWLDSDANEADNRQIWNKFSKMYCNFYNFRFHVFPFATKNQTNFYCPFNLRTSTFISQNHTHVYIHILYHLKLGRNPPSDSQQTNYKIICLVVKRMERMIS